MSKKIKRLKRMYAEMFDLRESLSIKNMDLEAQLKKMVAEINRLNQIISELSEIRPLKP